MEKEQYQRTFRGNENKYAAKVEAENSVAYAASFRTAMESVFQRYPGIKSDACLIWNMDGTSVTGECGETKKVFTIYAGNTVGYQI